MEWVEENGMDLLFNAAYSCTYNPIESMWAYAKRKFYKEEAILEAEAKFDSVERRVRKAI